MKVVDMVDVIEMAQRRERMEIEAKYNRVKLWGIADCDIVKVGGGRVKLRAKFDNGVRSVLDFSDYGKNWRVKPQEQKAEKEAEMKTAG